MDQRVRHYLIRAHSKVIAHYREVLRASSLAEPERERLRQGLAGVEAEFDAIRTGASKPHLGQPRDPPDLA